MKARTVFWLGMFAFAACIAMPSALPAQDKPLLPAKIKPAILPPDVAFGRSIAFIRGHLLTGDELVGRRQWSAAYPHFRFPTEEVYGVIREDLRTYKTPPFDYALKTLAYAVRAHSPARYRSARQKVETALAAADAGLRARQPNWPRFVVAVAVEVLKAAPDEYDDAVAKGRVVRPIGYQTGRGFILQADRMFESVAGELGFDNAAALGDMRDGFAQLKQGFASVTPPRRPIMDPAAVFGTVSQIELAAGKLR
jgi:hypothetical protein